MESPSMELRSAEAFMAMVKGVLEDAVTRFEELATQTSAGPVEFAGLDVYSFKQTWPDGSRGFGGIATQVLTDAQSVVVSWTHAAVAAVYIGGEFGYLVHRPNAQFWQGISDRRLPGAAEPREQLGG